jgi:fructose 5-dehydrogenase cytochrome subunit
MTGARSLNATCASRVLAAACLVISLYGLSGLARAQTADPTGAALIEQGRYVAVAGDCAACHTKPNGGKPFAGGYGIVSPLGAIVATNITPSKNAGIGTYTETQFADALRHGVRADGAHLYPAMPYTSFAGMTDADVHALYTYFMNGVAPVDDVPPPTKLPFPFNLRLSMVGWNLLFLDDRRFTPNATKSPEWNRGAYLTGVLEHCDACHTPRNLLMAETDSKAFAGASLGSWYAPNITSDPVSGIGGWSNAELVQYFKTGVAHGKGQAAGGMAEAVQNSLQFLTPDDLAAIAVYVKTIPAIRDPGETQPPYAEGSPADFEAGLRGKAKQTSGGPIEGGAALFSGYCASCHQPTGSGTPNQSYPALFHNSTTGGVNADDMVSAILFGVDRTVGDNHVLMPRFDQLSFVQMLSDEQIASISLYVAQQFGNSSLHVTAADVATIRAGGPAPPLAAVSTYAVPALVIVAVIIIALIAVLLVQRRRHPPVTPDTDSRGRFSSRIQGS